MGICSSKPLAIEAKENVTEDNQQSTNPVTGSDFNEVEAGSDSKSADVEIATKTGHESPAERAGAEEGSHDNTQNQTVAAESSSAETKRNQDSCIDVQQDTQTPIPVADVAADSLTPEVKKESSNAPNSPTSSSYTLHEAAREKTIQVLDFIQKKKNMDSSPVLVPEELIEQLQDKIRKSDFYGLKFQIENERFVLVETFSKSDSPDCPDSPDSPGSDPHVEMRTSWDKMRESLTDKQSCFFICRSPQHDQK